MHAMKMDTPKVFGIGLSKTGTSSLAHALEILGYRTKDYPGIERYVRGELSSVDLEVIDAHDAVTDTPIPSFYRELDARYPNSKFILTVRERDAWLKSCRKQFTEKLAEKQNDAHKYLFLDLYGTDVFDEQKFSRGYEEFVEKALKFFENRRHDLLVIDIAAGEGWEKLCAFLGKPIPDIPFPKANVTQVRWIDITDVVAVAKRAGREFLAEGVTPPGAAAPGNGSLSTYCIADARRSRSSGGYFRKAIRALRGGDQAALQRATGRAYDSMLKGLQRLAPQIPVLSRERGAILDSGRTRWNHMWLVDATVAASETPEAHGEFTVSIALIEDGAPIYGVVYAPVPDTVYYGKIGYGAFSANRGEPPERLPARPARSGPQAMVRGKGIEGTSVQTRGAEPGPRVPHALLICTCLAGDADGYRCDEPTTEWDTAAAQAIASALGRKIVDCRSGEALTCNKKDMTNRCFMVD
jgi:3'-phosphoadenosine 5'-phosphosulfate (PAPS) 3'-phosphatase